MLMYEKAINFYHYFLASQACFALQLEGFPIPPKTATTLRVQIIAALFEVAHKSYEMLEI